MEELWLLSMTRCLNVFYKCMEFRWNSFYCYQVKERTRISKENNFKYIQSSYGSCAWRIVSLCSRSVWSLSQTALTVFNLQSGHNIAFSYVTREMIWKINMQELWFLCMARRLNVLYKYVKFRILFVMCNIYCTFICMWNFGKNIAEVTSRWH